MTRQALMLSLNTGKSSLSRRGLLALGSSTRPDQTAVDGWLNVLLMFKHVYVGLVPKTIMGKRWKQNYCQPAFGNLQYLAHQMRLELDDELCLGGEVGTLLDNPAARHKLAVRPRKRHTGSRQRDTSPSMVDSEEKDDSEDNRRCYLASGKDHYAVAGHLFLRNLQGKLTQIVRLYSERRYAVYKRSKLSTDQLVWHNYSSDGYLVTTTLKLLPLGHLVTALPNNVDHIQSTHQLMFMTHVITMQINKCDAIKPKTTWLGNSRAYGSRINPRLPSCVCVWKRTRPAHVTSCMTNRLGGHLWSLR
ncbi:hypothetical protein J6590_010072 [Homalodisca vitripennis]|nr:hypothetical protein J6590_010072 [Homalodisca vitripennis]